MLAVICYTLMIYLVIAGAIFISLLQEGNSVKESMQQSLKWPVDLWYSLQQ